MSHIRNRDHKLHATAALCGLVGIVFVCCQGTPLRGVSPDRRLWALPAGGVS